MKLAAEEYEGKNQSGEIEEDETAGHRAPVRTQGSK